MAIEPQVFLCYGRPDRDIAHAVAYEFSKKQIECYNYLAKPVEDRLGKESPHLSYVIACGLFVAVLSPETIMRKLVVEEILLASRIAGVAAQRNCRCRAYILATDEELKGPLPSPDLLFSYDRLTDIPRLVSEMMTHMGSVFVEHAQKAWTINKGLYPKAWAAAAAKYSKPPPPLKRILPPGRNSVFPGDQIPEIAELMALGRERLHGMRSSAVERLDNLSRVYGLSYRPGRQAFLDWSLKLDLEMIDKALEELDKGDRGHRG
jgi:hypothetical protein